MAAGRTRRSPAQPALPRLAVTNFLFPVCSPRFPLPSVRANRFLMCRRANSAPPCPARLARHAAPGLVSPSENPLGPRGVTLARAAPPSPLCLPVRSSFLFLLALRVSFPIIHLTFSSYIVCNSVINSLISFIFLLNLLAAGLNLLACWSICFLDPLPLLVAMSAPPTWLCRSLGL